MCDICPAGFRCTNLAAYPCSVGHYCPAGGWRNVCACVWVCVRVCGWVFLSLFSWLAGWLAGWLQLWEQANECGMWFTDISMCKGGCIHVYNRQRIIITNSYHRSFPQLIFILSSTTSSSLISSPRLFLLHPIQLTLIFLPYYSFVTRFFFPIS